MRLLARADIVLTDSGGIQEEAPYLGKPVIVTRAVTERPEASQAGAASVIGTDAPTIVRAVNALLDDTIMHATMSRRSLRPTATATRPREFITISLSGSLRADAAQDGERGAARSDPEAEEALRPAADALGTEMAS